MSPTDSPKSKSPFVPLPAPLPKKEEDKSRKDKATKNKPKPLINHKSSYSADTGYGSGTVSPYPYEERSPEQYSSSPLSARPRSDTFSYEMIDGKSRATRYVIGKDGKRVRYVSRTPEDQEYVPGPPAVITPDPYKSKYKEVKETTKVLQQALAEETETALHNFNAARQEEMGRLSSAAHIEDIEAQLRALRLAQKILEDRVVDAETAQKKAEQRLKQKELEDELADRKREREVERKLELEREEERLRKKQWDEIEARPAPTSRRRPAPVVNQVERRPSTKRNSTVLATTGYGQTAVTPTTRPPAVISPANLGMDAILEAQRDWDARDRDEEDRSRATEVRVNDTRRTTRDRERDRSKRNSFRQ